MNNRVKTIHMVGIGGSGMSGIAEVLLNLNYRVHGSDLAESATVRRLRELGAEIWIGHHEDHVSSDVNVLVKSTAVSAENPEVLIARERSIPIIPRAEMLAELMRLKTGIAIAGMHGKTTTTSLTAAILDEAALDPTVIIGGLLNAYGANARLGGGDYLVAEADESDGSFLCLAPIMTVVTNIDLEHLDYYKDQETIDKAFMTFMNKIPFYGVNVVCGDDPGVRRVLPHINRPVLTYGFGKGNDITAEIIQCDAISRFVVRLKGCLLGEATLNHPGRHNILNSLAAIGVCMQADVPAEVCLRGLAKFRGVGRRFEFKGEKNGVRVVDDYGHHPAEIKATLGTARQCFPDKRIVVAFQPHRFSRTQALFGDFCKAFDSVDKLLLTEIYAASEKPIPGVSGESLAQGIRQVSSTEVTFCRTLDEVVQTAREELREGDLFLTLGAGNITTVGPRWLEDR